MEEEGVLQERKVACYPRNPDKVDLPAREPCKSGMYDCSAVYLLLSENHVINDFMDFRF